MRRWSDRLPPILRVDDVEGPTFVIIGLFNVGIGIIFGGALGFFLYRNIVFGVLVLGPPIAIVGFLITWFIVERSGVAARGLHTPSGDGTPGRSELSRETALVVAERFDEAVDALMIAGERDPTDVRPPLMIAELFRDRMERPEEAVPWLRRAAAVPGLALETERMILRDLVELCVKIDRPELASPALSRAASVHGGDRLGHWARQELRAIKEGMAGD